MKNEKIKLIGSTGFILFVSIYGKSLFLNYFLGSASDVVFYTGQLLIEISIIFLSLYVLKKLGKQDLLQFKKPKISYVAFIPFCYILIIFWNALTHFLFPTTQNQQIVENLVSSTDTFIISTILLVILAPMYEELVFRALTMTWLENYQTFYIDIIVSSILFALLHIMDKGLILSDFIYYLGLGLIFGFFYRKTKRIGYTILLHFLINFISWIILTFVR